MEYISLPMELKREIIHAHTRKQAQKIADLVGDNPSRFKVLVEIYQDGPYRITQRAAWPLSLCVERHPHLIKPHFAGIIRFVLKPGVHDAVKRNTMRLLQFVDIPKRYHGEVIDVCFQFLHDKKAPVAVKAFSMTVLKKLIEDHPGLQKELKIILEDQLPYSSPAFRVRAVKILKDLQGVDGVDQV